VSDRPCLPVGIVGFGFMGSVHAQVYSQLPGIRVVGIADQRPVRAAQKLYELGWEVPIYASLQELIERHPGLAIIDICTPGDRHEEDAAIALSAEKHLFCEKPLALTLAAADRLVALAERSRRFVQVGHCIRFWPEYIALREFVAGRTAGRLLSLALHRQASRPEYSDGDWLNQAGRSGGAAVDLHIHDTDFILSLLGAPSAVTSRATFDASGPSHIFTLYDYPEVVVSAEGGWNYPNRWGFRMAFQALFEQACVDFDSTRSPSLSITWPGKAPSPLAYASPPAGAAQPGEGNIELLGGYYNELKYFVECIAAGKAPAMATVQDARRALAVVLAEIGSAKTGQTVPLP
jgi:predicted dehydrogenase